MLHTNNPIIKHKVGLLNLAEELNNISRACTDNTAFYRALKKAGIENCRFHDLRHMSASWLIQAGVFISALQEMC